MATITITPGESFNPTEAVTSTKLNNLGSPTAALTPASIGTTDIADDAITIDKVNANAVGTSQLINDSVNSDKILDSSVIESKIATDAVTTSKIEDLAVTTDKINNSAVTEGKIATDAVTTVKIEDLAVTEGKIAANAVTTVKILDAQVTPAKLSTGAPTWSTAGNIITNGGTIEINANLVGDAAANLDFHSTDASNPDYDARIVKYTGENSSFDIINNGTGNTNFYNGGGIKLKFVGGTEGNTSIHGGEFNSGANIELYGNLHPTAANKAFFDADVHQFRSAAGSTATSYVQMNMTDAGLAELGVFSSDSSGEANVKIQSYTPSLILSDKTTNAKDFQIQADSNSLNILSGDTSGDAPLPTEVASINSAGVLEVQNKVICPSIEASTIEASTIQASTIFGPESADVLTLRADPQSPDPTNGGAQISLHSSDSAVPNQIYTRSAFTFFQNMGGATVASIGSAGPAVAKDLVTKEYLDNRGVFTPSTYAGEESVTLPNGLIMKFGLHTTTMGTNSITFGTAFPSVCINVQYSRQKSTWSAFNENGCVVGTPATTGFNVYIDGSAWGNFYWTAIGY